MVVPLADLLGESLVEWKANKKAVRLADKMDGLLVVMMAAWMVFSLVVMKEHVKDVKTVEKTVLLLVGKSVVVLAAPLVSRKADMMVALLVV